MACLCATATETGRKGGDGIAIPFAKLGTQKGLIRSKRRQEIRPKTGRLFRFALLKAPNPLGGNGFITHGFNPCVPWADPAYLDHVGNRRPIPDEKGLDGTVETVAHPAAEPA